MKMKDYLEPEVGVAVAVTAATAALASPKVRRAVRAGAVYGLAGLMMAGDRLLAMATAARKTAGPVAEEAAAEAAEVPATPT